MAIASLADPVATRRGPAAGPRWVPLVAGVLVAVVASGWVVLDLHHHRSGLLGLLQPGAQGPAAAVIAHDFSHATLPPGGGNDGQQFYAIARDPLHATAAAASLDRPRYRLERPGLPVLAWMLHPTGGGDGLVWALVVVNLAGLVLGGAALATWARMRGRSPWWGLTLAALPGGFISLRITCADALAGALALAAVVLAYRGKVLGAAALAGLAALTKESSILMLAGPAWWAWRHGGRRTGVALAVPALVLPGLLWMGLQVTLPGGHQYAEFARPFGGLVAAARYWIGARDWKPALTVLATVTAAICALRRRPGPFTWSIGLLLMLTAVLSLPTLAFWTSAPRVLLPLGLCTLAHVLDGPPQRLSAPRPAPA